MSWKIAPIGRGGDLLYSQAGTPSLDLRFAEKKALTDYVSGDNLVDFSRASPATYVGSDGLIKTATTNLLTYSEDWSQIQADSNTTITVDDTTAPNGAVTADKITATTTGAFNDCYRQKLATIPVNTETYTASWFVKRGNTGKTFFQVAVAGGTYISVFGVIDWTQSPVTFAFNGLNGSPVYTIHPLENRGGGWYRVAISIANNNTGNSITCRIYASDRFSTVTGDYVYLWGAQLEQSSTVGEYVPTTSAINSAPRFDHNPTTGESLGLLVEGQRTNFILNTSPATSGTVLLGAVADTASNILAPDGELYTVRRVSFPSQGTYRFGDTSSGIASTTYTGSVWMRTESGTVQVLLDVNDSAPATTVTVTQDWKRFSASGVSATQPYRFFDITGSSGQVILFWGAQLEQGAFPTSYIKNVDTPLGVTRLPDIAQISGSILSSGGGNTLFAQFRSPASGTRPIVSLDDNSANERIELFTSGTDPKLLVTDGGVAQADIDAGTIAANTSTRLAARFAANDFAASVGGNTLVIDTSGTMPTVDRIRIGRDQAGNYLNGHIARLAGWDSSLELLSSITQ